MATQYSSNRPSGTRNTSARPAGARPTGARPTGARPASARPSGTRPPQRPQNGRRPNRRKKKPQGRFYLFLAALLVIVIVVVVLVTRPSGGNDAVKQPAVTAAADQSPVSANDTSGETPVSAGDVTSVSALSDLLGSTDTDIGGLTADQMVNVSDLSINPNLPSDWINILLLGSDERHLGESARTDAMIICSVNTTTGQIKLSSVLRDLAVTFDDIGKYNGTYRINSANFFGGETLAMKTFNECFNLNIDRYVHVNFFGLTEIAQMLGGIDVDITEAEKDIINRGIVEIAMAAATEGIDDSAVPKEFLESYGPNTHLDGRQTVAYARIRHLDGGDFARTERQRTVLTKLLNKIKSLGAADMVRIGTEGLKHVRTNMTVGELLNLATLVCANDVSSLESFRLPINNSYKQESRNNQDMLYDCDWSANASELYTFIYG